MSLPWVRRHYRVPAIRGGIIHFDHEGQRGTILSATHYLHVRLADDRVVWLHPTWHVRYQECHEAVVDRDGYEVPCERPAVGYRYDPYADTGDPYPVCRRHHRGPFTEDEARAIAEKAGWL